MKCAHIISIIILSVSLTTVAHAEKVEELSEITVSGVQEEAGGPSLGASRMNDTKLSDQKSGTSDSAQLLQDIPGVSLYGAGGISSLPVIHGLADDRISIQVDGMELMSACPNHMNSALSYIDPNQVAEVTVYTGITPVSAGGDSIGGSIQVKSPPPLFATADEGYVAKGQAGTFYRSNGTAIGYNFGATAANTWLNLSYRETSSRSDNYRAGGTFKPAAKGSETGRIIPGDEVASSAYNGATNREVGIALRRGGQTLQLNLSRQLVGFEGYPNQRMDMTANDNRLLNLRYQGRFEWGDLEGRVSYQDTRHKMDMGADRYFYGTGMPMLTRAKTKGAALQGNMILSDSDTLRVGAEFQNYILYDWWPPVGGSMGPNDFWNIDYGRRNRFDAYLEWETHWNPAWTSLLGLRSNTVWTDAAAVQGYDNGLAGVWGNDAAAFNARAHDRTDYNWDLALLQRYTPAATQTYEAGYSRKTRTPSLYQRYPWATNPMAALMNNFVGDGNGYVGNPDLKPETANTFSATGDWHDAGREQWEVKATGYYTYIQDYIDARRCDFGQCSPANVNASSGFVLLQYVNQRAQLYGFDLSGRLQLVNSPDYGTVTGSAIVNYVRGENLTTGDDLYNIMPLNMKLAAEYRLKGLTVTGEFLAVADKKLVSHVRNEMQTGGYTLLNLRSSYEWRFARLDFGIENLLDRLYSLPLGGAYVGQGPSMTTNGIPWGTPVPGKGRSFNLSLNLKF